MSEFLGTMILIFFGLVLLIVLAGLLKLLFLFFRFLRVLVGLIPVKNLPGMDANVKAPALDLRGIFEGLYGWTRRRH